MNNEIKKVTTESDKNKLASEDNESNGMFGWSRETIQNRMTYKKSAETLRLNERPHRNPGIRPIKVDLWALPKREEVKGKPRQGFIEKMHALFSNQKIQ